MFNVNHWDLSRDGGSSKAGWHGQATPHSVYVQLDAVCTLEVVTLRSTSYIAIELNVLHLKSYEIQSNQCAQAILPSIAFLRID